MNTAEISSSDISRMMAQVAKSQARPETKRHLVTVLGDAYLRAYEREHPEEAAEDDAAYTAYMLATYGEHAEMGPQPDPIPPHDCPREEFLDDPITVAYGVGSEMLHLISCPVCALFEGE